MLLTETLSLHFANILHADLEDPESKFSKSLDKAGTRGKPAAIQALKEFLMESEHPHCKDKSTTVPTVTDWVEKLTTKMGAARRGSILNQNLLPQSV
jgi:hypothetical protein